MPRPLRLTFTLLAWAGAAPGFAAEGLTAYRGQDWAHLQATTEQATLWLGPERAVELPATVAPAAPVRYDDLVLLGRTPDGAQEWAAAGVSLSGNGPRLRLYGGREGRIRAVSPPQRPPGAIQIASVRWLAAAEPEPLRALAWLEATRPRAQEVWLSPYRDGQFGTAVRLVGAGPGSQTALDAAVLADGSWLLVWSAFDGHDMATLLEAFHGVDDELVWRQRQAG